MQGGRNTREKTGARRWLIVTLVCGLTAFAVSASATLADSPQAGGAQQEIYINSPWVEQPVMPTYFSPNDIFDLLDDIYCGAFGENSSCSVNSLYNYVDYIQWSSWGGEQAVGSGRVALLDEAGSTSPVTVTLSQPVRCAGLRVYTRYDLQLADGATAPASWPKGQSGMFPCGRISVAGNTGNHGASCAFDGIHVPKANDPDYAFPADWRPGLPKITKHPEVSFCFVAWKHWGARVAIGKGVAEIGGNAPHTGRVWPVKLELGNPFWCPRIAEAPPITYRTLKATFYGKGLEFRSATSFDNLLTRWSRLRAQVGRPGLKRRVYRQGIKPTLKDCQAPFRQHRVLRPPVIERYQ